MGLKHRYQTVTPDDPGAEISSTEWNDDHDVIGTLEFPHNAAPTAPAAGKVALFGHTIAGRTVPAFMPEVGAFQELQTLLHAARYWLWMPSFNGTTSSNIGMGNTNNYTNGTGALWGNSSMLTRMRRENRASPATVNGFGGIRTSNVNWSTGNGTGLGGFTASFRFCIADAAPVADARMFVGFTTATAAYTGLFNPDAILNCIGIGHGPGDANLQLYYGGSAAQTPIDLGANFPANTAAADIYEVTMVSPPNMTGTVYVQVDRLNTGHSVNYTLSGSSVVLPQAATGLAIHALRTNGATALATLFSLMHIAVTVDN